MRGESSGVEAQGSVRTRLLLAALAGIGLFSLVGYVGMAAAADAARRPEANWRYIQIAIPLFCIYGAACYIVLRWGRNLPVRPTLAVIGLVAVLARAVLVPAAPTLSNDVYRYVWDGRIMAAGISPYAYPPGAPEVKAFAPEGDPIWPYINRKGAITIYPPGAELFYAAIYNLNPNSVTWTKAAMSLVDLANCLLVVLLLRRFSMPVVRSLIYAWSPLPIIEFASSGHVETLSVFWTLLALLAGTISVQSYASGALRRGQVARIASGVCLAGAGLVKLIPMLLLSAWVRRFGAWVALLAVGLFAAVYAGFTALTGGYISPFLLTYLGKEESNSAVYYVLSRYIGPATGIGDEVIRGLLILATIAGAMLILLKRERGHYDFIGKSFLLVTLYLLFATNAHPWYATWPLAFLPLMLPPNGLPLFSENSDMADGKRLRRGYYGLSLAVLAYTCLTFTGYLVPAMRVPDVPAPVLLFQLVAVVGLGVIWPLAGHFYTRVENRHVSIAAPPAVSNLTKEGA